ncbi:MORN repeat-containing protein [Bradyrhizobium sp. AUGA SZCCT0240]|uniref:MORN repeat-containing protein n=1 Tax=Bradyrhizobium sp. AUGA SZCCT0240 TaxID=2807669 RepID=UPI002011AB4A|nr:hypothetical protein [Bradyrhizobium sp. AUGA SZCCT0240]
MANFPAMVARFVMWKQFGWALCAFLAYASFGAPAWSQKERAIVDGRIGDHLGVELGRWRTKVQHGYDPRSRALFARHYTVFDAAPAHNLDFVWIPDNLRAARSGAISGRGRLVWRLTGSPAHDASGTYSVYVGFVRNGRPHGSGRYVNRDGLVYDGEWRKGRFEGSGFLQLSTGEEYQGRFRKGRASGQGRYVDVTGEVFEGAFADGLREGAGKTTLPGGIVYRSHWSGGIEVPGSVRIRIAQLNTQPPGVASGSGVRLGVAISKKPKSQDILPGEALGYTSKVVGDALLIQPDDPQLVSVWKEKGTIQTQVDALRPSESSAYRQSLFGFDRNIIHPPKLSLEVQNRTSDRIGISNLYLDVKKSESENQPAIDVQEGVERELCSNLKGDNRGNFAPYITLKNYGWGTIEQATFRFAMRPTSDIRDTTTFEFAKEIGHFEKTTKIDLTDEIANLGARLPLLRRYGRIGFECKAPDSKSDNPTRCLQELRATGAFGGLSKIISLKGIDIVVGVRGSFEYAYRNSKGELISDVSPLRVDINVGGLIEQAECGEGGPPEPIKEKPIALKLDQENYKIELPLPTKSIDPGRSSQIALVLNAPQASRHEFQLVAKLTDGQLIRSRSVNLLYFTPKWYPKPNY